MPGAPRPVSGSDGPGGVGSGGADDGVGAGGTGRPPPDCSGAAVPVDTARRLNVTELNTIASDVLAIDDAPFDAVGTDYGERVGAFLGTTERFISDYFDVTEDVARRFVTERNVAVECRTASCAAAELRSTITLLLRRPVTQVRLQALESLAQEAMDSGLGMTEAMTSIIWSVLNAPDFLLIGTQVGATPGPHVLDGYSVAERMALALWNSVPDAQLIASAEAGALLTDEGIEREVRRMLSNPVKGTRFLDGFVRTHFDLASGAAIPPGLDGFSDAGQLAADMGTEARLLIEQVFRENRNIDRLIRSDSTFLNRRLSRHYGLSDPGGSGFSEAPTEGTERIAGLLTTAAVLAQEGDLIHRGVNILQSFMCLPLVAPDPEILEAASSELPADASVREQVAFRTSNTACAGCHRLIDPLGAAFERFDEAGQIRSQYENGDSVLYDAEFLGRRLRNPDDVTQALVEGDFASCLSSQLLGWVSSRRMSLSRKNDSCASEAVLTAARGTVDGSEVTSGDAASSQVGFQDIVVQAILSETFRTRVVD